MGQRRDKAEKVVNALMDYLRSNDYIEKVYALEDKNRAVKAAGAICGECVARQAALDAERAAKQAAQVRKPSVPWEWESHYGEWGLWDEAGNALIIEGSFVEAQIDPYVEAVTATAPEMEQLLRLVLEAMRVDVETRGLVKLLTPKIGALLERIDKARAGD